MANLDQDDWNLDQDDWSQYKVGVIPDLYKLPDDMEDRLPGCYGANKCPCGEHRFHKACEAGDSRNNGKIVKVVYGDDVSMTDAFMKSNNAIMQSTNTVFVDYGRNKTRFRLVITIRKKVRKI